MSTTFTGTFNGHVIVPDVPLTLPVGEKLRVQVETPSGAGQFQALTEFAVDLPDSPGDLAAEHDHYLYGTPKRTLE